MKVSDYIADFIYKLGVNHVFTVSGAGDLHLLESIHKHPELEYICNHHEQASGMAAYAYSRTNEQMGVAIITTGPGGTNTITGVCSAWMDSIPCLIISGQVKYSETIAHKALNLRQYGIQEINIIDIVRPFTKYSVMITEADQVRYHLEKSIYLARHGRPGPVWIDLPMDIQAAEIEPDRLKSFKPELEFPVKSEDDSGSEEIYKRIIGFIKNSQRPILIAGYGVKAAKATASFEELANLLEIPVITTWNGIDLLPHEHPLYVGRAGTYGQRGANFAVQNCDFLLTIGARLSIPQVGYEYSEFARAAKKVYVDIDPAELNKFSIKPDIAICADAKDFIDNLIKYVKNNNMEKSNSREDWQNKCQIWKEKYPTALPEYQQQKKSINSFAFIDTLSDLLADDELIIPGSSGTGYTCTHQALKIKKNQKCFTSNGMAEMGFDLPGAIGACIAADKKRTVLVVGDGSMQMNIQELQTIISYQLPIKIFYLNNQGYLTIRQTQTGLFKGSFSGSDPKSGVICPDIKKIAYAYGIQFYSAASFKNLKGIISKTLNKKGPVICEIVMDPRQPLVPKTSFKIKSDGKMVSPPLEDLFPFLPRDEFRQNMVIPTIKDDF